MDLAITKSQQLATERAQPTHPPSPSFPIIAVAIIGILATAFLLVSYYVFVIKCCLNWHRVDLLGRFSLSRRRRSRNDDGLLLVPAAAAEDRARGLDESAIRSIPVFRYKNQSSSAECAVCLGEYREGDHLRLIPGCLHSFHIDCIDVWLHTSPNCPLCRSSVSAAPPPPIFPVAIEIAPESSGGGGGGRRRKMMSMGDECIVAARDGNDESFHVEPIRRSFSMDSCADLLAVQDAVRRHCGNAAVGAPDGTNGSVRRSFFSFGNASRGASRTTTSAVLPVYLEP